MTYQTNSVNNGNSYNPMNGTDHFIIPKKKTVNGHTSNSKNNLQLAAALQRLIKGDKDKDQLFQ